MSTNWLCKTEQKIISKLNEQHSKDEINSEDVIDLMPDSSGNSSAG